jgi:hypothetical protein
LRWEIFDKIKHHISNGYAIAYVVDDDTSTVIDQFESMGMPILDFIDKGVFTVVSRDLFYSAFVPSNMLLNQWNKLFANMKKNAGNNVIKGLMAVGMPAESFFLSDVDRQQLVNYESLASKNYGGSMEAMCLYTAKTLDNMKLGHIVSLLNAHQNTGHRNRNLREWNVKRGLELIHRGFVSVLEPRVAEMVRAIIVRDFGDDERQMVMNPDDLERKLVILLGESAAQLVISRIKDEIIKDIIF